jgi:hypothetical protein
MVSSAYYRIDKPSSIKCGIMPVNYPWSFALLISKDSISATILNKIGDIGPLDVGSSLFGRSSQSHHLL